MAYGREQLRKAGKALLDLDERYTTAVREGTVREGDAMGEMTRGASIRDLMGSQNMSGDSFMEQALGNAALGAVAAGNVATRYGLPAAGVTLAGKGLLDLTGMFVGDEQTPGTVMPS